MKNETTIFYDVDTQRDFLLPDGKFYIPGAEKIIPTLEALTNLAREQKVRIVCSMDCHNPNDPMLKSNGGPYPDHCIVDTPGQRKIDQTAPLNPIFLKNKEYSPAEIQQVLDHEGEIIFLRQQFDRLANNAHVRTIMRLILQPYRDIVAYGVYAELCVDRLISSLLGVGPKVTIVRDAVVSPDADVMQLVEKWRQEGVSAITFNELKTRMYN
jgi:nicotinamidase/pyrazinamidase